MSRFLLSVLLFIMVSPFCMAQTTDPEKLGDLTARQKQAEAEAKRLSHEQDQLTKQINILQDDLVSTSAQSRGYEKAQNIASARLKDLEHEERALLAIILEDQRALADTLAAMQRIENNPPPTFLITSGNVKEATRAAMLLSGISQELHTRSDTLKQRLADLEMTRVKMDAQRRDITKNAQEVDTRLVNIRGSLSKKAALNSKLDQDHAKKVEEANKLAAEANTLRELIATFEDNAADITPRLKPSLNNPNPTPRMKPNKRRNAAPIYIPPDSLRFADARDELPLPVFGTLSRSFGARIPGGGKSKGMILTTSFRAQVISPFPGRIEYAGLFNNDYVIIVNVGDGYFIVFSGLGAVFTQAGTLVKAGEPLGVMPQSGAQKPELFMEFRKNKVSIDPRPWVGTALATQKTK